MPLRDPEYHICWKEQTALNELLRLYSIPTLKQTQLKGVSFFKPIVKEDIKLTIISMMWQATKKAFECYFTFIFFP